MRKDEYLSIKEVSRIMGISRIAVYKKVKKGQIKAIRVGRVFAIPKKSVTDIVDGALNEKGRKEIDLAVKRTVKEYGEVLKLLGRE